jgi:hypothetical protein
MVNEQSFLNHAPFSIIWTLLTFLRIILPEPERTDLPGSIEREAAHE